MDSPEGGWYEWLFVRLVIFGILWEIFNELVELLCEARPSYKNLCSGVATCDTLVSSMQFV